MYIHEVIIDGFKSYAQRTVVGPFDKSFNAITGLNGSGKSNILDSICFVLGITQLSNVRVSSLQELVYKSGQAGITKASVTIVFNNEDKDESPIGYESHDQITITRQVVLGGRNKYMINGHTAQLSRVQNLFHSVQLNVNNPHFLIMQGRITKVLNMKPIEILGMLEEAAGTRMYEMKKSAALKTIEKKESKVKEINKVVNEEVTPKVERLRSERAAYIEWSKNKTLCEQLARFVTAAEFTQRSELLQQAHEQKSVMDEKRAQILERESTIQAELDSTLQKANALQKKREEEMEHLFVEREKVATNLSKALVKETATWKHKKDSVQAEAKNVKELEASVVEMEKTIASKTVEMEKATKEAEALVAEVSAAREELSTLEARQQAISAGMAQDDSGESLAKQLEIAKKKTADATKAAKRAQLQIKHMSAELKKIHKLTKAGEAEHAKSTKKLEFLQRAVLEAETKLKRLGHTLGAEEELAKSLAEQNETLRTLRSQVSQLEKRCNLSFDYATPAKGFDRSRVKGLVANLVSVKDSKTTTALEVTAGNKMFHVVVDTDETGKLLLKKGRLQRRVTIIPLNKIQDKTLSKERQAAAAKVAGGKKNAQLALELVGFDEEIEAAMKFVFGTTLVCRDLDTARAVTFDPKVRCKSVTLEGDMFDPAGTLTGGSRQKTASVLQYLSKLNDMRKNVLELEDALKITTQKEAAARRMAEQDEKLRHTLEVKQHEVRLMEERMSQSSHAQHAQRATELEAELEGLKEAQRQAQEMEKECLGREQELSKTIEESKKERGQRMKEMTKSIAAIKKKLQTMVAKEEKAKDTAETLGMELEELREELIRLGKELESSKATLSKEEAALASCATVVAEKKAEYEAAQEELDAQKKRLTAADAERAELDKARDRLQRRLENNQLELKKLDHTITRHGQEQKKAASDVARMLSQHPWIEAERELFGRPGLGYDFKERNPKTEAKRLKQLQTRQETLERSINKKAMSMFEKAEEEYQRLIEKRTIIERDRKKIEAVIAELDLKKNEALETTWRKVNKDFGSIFGTLLPGTNAKLEPPEGMTLMDGLDVRVQLGSVWKESLTELSGGQRSLLALSLILALLLFKPAPMYILDEIDAALDLSHTQNIGTMLRNHFSHSQFVVVSLKEGMFNNANALFRTKFVDGISTVRRTTPGRENASDGKGKGKASQESGRKRRKALKARQ